MTSETNVLIFSLLGGVLPALFWLWFWIREDRLNPEPKFALLSAFFGGILAVLLALFFELIIYHLFVDANLNNIRNFPEILRTILQNLTTTYDLTTVQTQFWGQIQNLSIVWNPLPFYIDARKFFLLIIIAPMIEELLKLLFTFSLCLRRKVNDEPIDASIYMLTAALGFAAVETALFLVGPLTKGEVIDSLIAGNFRSMGPMLIHLISSAMLGIFIGLAFYKSKAKKLLYLITGYIIAFLLHALFNFFIMLNESTQNINFFWVANLGTWSLVIILLVFFERIKKVTIPARGTS